MLSMASLVLSLAGMEATLRLLTAFPIHGRLANRQADSVLGYRMDRRLPDVDANGFRNATRPDQAEIVVLGDSHTYGYNVEASESWPSQLATMTGRSVYNMGVGGYGAYQYRALLDEALSLRPRVLVAAVYLLNDAADLCRSQQFVEDRATWERVTGLEWAECGTSGSSAALDAQPLSEWVSSHSASVSWLRWAYGVHRMRRILDGTLQESAKDVVIRDRLGARYYFRASTTRARARSVDLPDRHIALGLEQLVLFAGEADRRLRALDGRFVVLFVPTREGVYADELQAAGRPPGVGSLLKGEAALQAALEDRIRQLGIPHVSAGADLASAKSEGQRIYPDGEDDHPVGAGYRAYAAAVRRILIY
jgi:hypothetical protein